MTKLNREPAAIVGAITGLAAAIVALVVAFQPDLLTEEQQAAILGVVAVVAPIIATLITRQFVTPDVSVVERLEGADAVVAGPANDMAHEGDLVRRLSDTKVHTD